MSSYIPESMIDHVEDLKDNEKFDDALDILNGILSKNPHNEEALLQVTDIWFRKGDITRASKAIDFLNKNKNYADPLGLYVKGVLEMEKNRWDTAKKYLKMAIELTHANNHEIMRCYALSEYWYGNREKGINLLEDAFLLNGKDVEIIYNLSELYLLERKYSKAKEMIAYYHKNHKNLQAVDKEMSFYDYKMLLFEKFLKVQKKAVHPIQ